MKKKMIITVDAAKQTKSSVKNLHCNFQGVIITPLVGLI